VYTVALLYENPGGIDALFDMQSLLWSAMVVGVPNPETYSDYTEAKKKLHEIKLHIHNHCPEDKPTPVQKMIMEQIIIQG
jgi:hypothetical protein